MADAKSLGRSEIIRDNLVFCMDEFKTLRDELAEVVGVSPTTVSYWRNGRNSISEQPLRAICRYYGVTVEQFTTTELRNAPSFKSVSHGGSTYELTEYEYALVSLNRRFRCVELDEEEESLIEDYRKCGGDAKARIAKLARDLAGSGQ